METVQKGFVTPIRILESEDSMTGTKIVQNIAKKFQRAVLFEMSLRAVPALHTELINFLGSRRRILITLATDVYQDEEDSNAAVEIVKGIISAGRRNQKTELPASKPSQSPQNQSNTTSSGSLIIWL